MIISASRRTDIPAFYSEWFINSIKKGFVLVQNPINPKIVSQIDLSSENIDLIVFWTKDARPLIKYLDEIDDMGYKYYFQWTITPYGKDIETNVADKKEIIQALKKLSERIGSKKIILRYDPVIFSAEYNLDFHIKSFKNLIEDLSDYTQRVVFSFLDFYVKIKSNLADKNIYECDYNDMTRIAESFANIATGKNLSLETCAEKIDLIAFGIEHSKCIDGELAEEILGRPLKDKNKKDNIRLHCGCIKSKDIGRYNTCGHNCLYCYANRAKIKNFNPHY